VFERAKVVLDLLGSSVVRIGNVGSGGAAKLVNNMIVGAEFAVIAEGFALAAKFGVSASTLFQAIRGGWAGSKVLEVSAPAMAERNFRPGGTVNMLSKDLGYARQLARERGVPVPVTAAVDEVFTTAKAFGNGEQAQPSIIQLWEKLLGIDVASGSNHTEVRP
jgi:2-hydroxy-3-oxopropionate reductase